MSRPYFAGDAQLQKLGAAGAVERDGQGAAVDDDRQVWRPQPPSALPGPPHRLLQLLRHLRRVASGFAQLQDSVWQEF